MANAGAARRESKRYRTPGGLSPLGAPDRSTGRGVGLAHCKCMGMAGTTGVAPLYIVQRIKLCTLSRRESIVGGGGGANSVPTLRTPAITQMRKQAEPRPELRFADLADAIGQAKCALRSLYTVLRPHVGLQSPG